MSSTTPDEPLGTTGENVAEHDVPEVDVTEVDVAETAGPEVDVPEVDGPEVDGPEVDVPDEATTPEPAASEATEVIPTVPADEAAPTAATAGVPLEKKPAPAAERPPTAPTPTQAPTTPQASPGAETASRRLRVATVVWGLMLAAVGVWIVAWASGARIDVQLALICLLAAGGVALLVGSIVSGARHSRR